MTLNKPRSYRKPVDQKCRSCTYDSRAVGTWRQQVTLCSVTKCPLYRIRPTTKAHIPEHVLDYYQVIGAERAFYRCSRVSEGRFNKHNQPEAYPAKGRA